MHSAKTLRPESDNPSRYAYGRRRGREFFRRPGAELFGNLPWRMRIAELVGIGRVTQSFDFGQFFATLLELVKRLKIQRDDPFKR